MDWIEKEGVASAIILQRHNKNIATAVVLQRRGQAER